MPPNADQDATMMARCCDLARQAVRDGERPFASVLCRNGSILSAAGNEVERDTDVTRHAEIVVMSQAQRLLGSKSLVDCTLYSIVEPCAMCSFAIRECGIGRVVYALGSPLMGGSSKWNVLGDDELSNAMPQVFGSPPDLVGGVLAKEAEKVWREWNPIYWTIIKLTGYLTSPAQAAASRRRFRVLKSVLSLFS